MIYCVYRSQYCTETILTLKYGMALPEFLDLKEYVDCMEAMDVARQKDHEIEQKRESDRGR